MASTIALEVVRRWVVPGAGAAGDSVMVMVFSSGEYVRGGVRRVWQRAFLGEGDGFLDPGARLLGDLLRVGVVEQSRLVQRSSVGRDAAPPRGVCAGPAWAL